MKRYRFLLLAFFLANNVHAEGLISTISVAPVVANINSTPYTKDATATDIKRTSPRNTTEVGSSVEPFVSGSTTTDTTRTKTIKTSGRGISCKTYEGKTYDQGEAGYADCMRNIKTDRQGTRTVP